MSPATHVHVKNPERVATGLKATLQSGRVSEAAKTRAKARLSALAIGVDTENPKFEKNVVHDQFFESDSRSHTPTVDHRFPAKQNAEVLAGNDMKGSVDHKVLGGYKATLSNPRTSQEAKDNAKKVLQLHGAL